MLSALLGAIDASPEEGHMELFVKESITHVTKRFSKKAQSALVLEGNDFKVLGNRDVFESIIYHLLNNAFYYVDRHQATTVICRLNPEKKTLSILNNGPKILPEEAPYLFDLGYQSKKESLGLGLTYCKKMLEGMRSGIRLLSTHSDPMTHFCLYFPHYSELPPEAQSFPIEEE
jgi:signal transduction histidine kinase